MVDKRKRPVSSVGRKKIKLDAPQEIPEVDNNRKEVNKAYSKLLSKDARDRVKLAQKALNLLGDDLLAASKKHDLCRVVQACLKYGSDQQKIQIYESLRPHYSELASGKYSYFLAKKLLKVGDKEQLLTEVLSNARSMFCTIHGIRFLDLLYKEGNYRARLLHAIFTPDQEFDSSEHNIGSEAILHLKDSVSMKKIMKKGLIDYPLVMHAVYLYLSACSEEEKLEILSMLHDKFESLVKCRYGTILAIQALAASDTKQRKVILKAAQPLVACIPDPESYAYLFFIKLIEVIDDTVRVKKMIILPVIQNLKAIIHSTNGAKFLMSIFPYDFSIGSLSTNEISALDENLNSTSKKDITLKKKEIFRELSEMLIREIEADFQEIINNARFNFLILGVALGIIFGELKSKSFIKVCSESIVNWDIMNHMSGHRILKKIIELESENGKIFFTKSFLKVITQKSAYLEKLMKSKGVWVFVSLAEKSGLKNKAKKILKACKNQLSDSQAGERTLLEILNKKAI